MKIHKIDRQGSFETDQYIVTEYRKIIGTAQIGYHPEYTCIYDVWITNEVRRKGYGEKLMKRLIKDVDGTVWLSVMKDNEAAIKLYEKLGFKFQYEANEIEDWYSIEKTS